MNRLILFFLLLLLWPVHAHAESTPVIQRIKSPKGLEAWLIEDHKLPLIAFQFAFEGGVETDSPDKQGLSVLMASLLTQGAGSYDEKAFQDALAAASIALDVEAGRDRITGTMKTLARNKDEAFKFLALALTSPRFEQSSFVRLKRQMQTLRKIQSAKPAWMSRYTLYRHIFQAHPYSQRALGTAQSLEALTREDIKTHHANLLARDNLSVAVVGAITAQELAPLLDQIFGALPEKSTRPNIPPVVWPKAPARTLVKRQGEQTEILFAAPMLPRHDPDWHAAQIANYILGGGGFTARLMTALRAHQGLTYGISTDLIAMEKASLLIGSVATGNTQVRPALDLLQTVWQDFYKNGAAEPEITAAQDFLTGSLPLSLTSTDAMAAMLLAMQTQKLGMDYLARYKERVRAVTKDQVQRVIQKWFDPQQLSFAMAGAPDNVTFNVVYDKIDD
ncbi:MAG: insulinase family protein [Alphaproteobacteria bacterium]|nr:insulinase family protein [Alphaproteobacteria bacterium]